jgi:hypothetical protein
MPSPWSRSLALMSYAITLMRSARVGGRSCKLHPPLHHLFCRAPCVGGGAPPFSPPLPFSAQIQWFEREEVLGVGLARQRRSRRPQGGGGRQGRRAGSSNERWGDWEEERREMRGMPQIPFSTLFLDHRIKMEMCLKD